jgi:arsenite methyltransferase
METNVIRDAVRERYGRIAREAGDGGCCGGSGCCAPGGSSGDLGYTPAHRASVPAGADLGLGCGNPQAIALLQPGERVLDLGSGGGFDAFLAAEQVGPGGHVIGVDMTPEMIARARRNTVTAGFTHVEFRLGEIERLPVADASIDVILSNCVINLSPDKPAVFREAFRVLAPGGRLAISDIVATVDLTPAMRADLAAYTGCIAGAALVADIEAMLRAAGFESVRIAEKHGGRELVRQWAPDLGADRFVVSAAIEAIKPAVAAAAAGSTSGEDAAPACCDTVLLSECCDADAKAGCCDPRSAPQVCGCSAGAGGAR